jgi:hypothetical protein
MISAKPNECLSGHSFEIHYEAEKIDIPRKLFKEK